MDRSQAFVRRAAALAVGLFLGGAWPAFAAEPRVFTIAGVESGSARAPWACVPNSACRPGSRPPPTWPATDRHLVDGTCLDHLPDGRVLLCSAYHLLELDRYGRARPLWPVGRHGEPRPAFYRGPGDVVVDPRGDIVFVISGYDTPTELWRVTRSSRRMVRVSANVPVAEPADIAMNPDGTVLIADFEKNVVVRVGHDGKATTVAGRRGEWGFAGDGGPAGDALLANPEGVLGLADGSFLIADTGNERVRRVATDGTITTLAGGGSGWLEGGQAAAVNLGAVTALESAPEGAVLIGSDRGILRLDGEGTVRTVVPGAETPFPWTGEPRQLTTDGGRRSDVLLSRVLKLDVLRDGALAALVVRPVEGDQRGTWISSPTRLMLIDPNPQVDRLAVGLPSENRFLLRRGVVKIVATRRASARLTVSRRGRVVTSARVRLAPGTTRVRVRVRRSAAPHVLHLGARDAAGRVATHRLVVIPDARLTRRTLRLARRALHKVPIAVFADHYIRRCRWWGRRTFRCWTTYDYEDGSAGTRSWIRLRRDGLIAYTERPGTFRIVLEPPT